LNFTSISITRADAGISRRKNLWHEHRRWGEMNDHGDVHTDGHRNEDGSGEHLR